MKAVFINAISSKSGGGKYVIENFIKTITNLKNDNFYVIAVPRKSDYLNLNNKKIKIIPLYIFSKQIFVPISSIIVLPILIFINRCKYVVNFADIPILTFAKQSFYFDQAYALDHRLYIPKIGNFHSKFVIFFKQFFYLSLLPFVDTLFVQTSYISNRIKESSCRKNIEVLPTPIVKHPSPKEFGKLKFKSNLLLFLSNFQPHKNFDILIPLAKSIKKNKLPYKIITTINSSECFLAEKFLENVYLENLEEVIINVGQIPLEKVNSLFSKVDALLLPTLMETYCIPYFEAMSMKKSILTSDLGFAREACGNAAYYFNPNSHKEILNKICLMYENKRLRNQKLLEGDNIYKNLINWKTFHKTIVDNFV